MAPPTLTALPTEILVRICSLLYESHIPSLQAFSLGNKHSFAIAATILAETITFNINKPAQLSQDVDACKQALRRHQLNLSQHVRRLVIVGRMDTPWVNAAGYGGTNPNWEERSDSESEDDEDGPRPDEDDKPWLRNKAKRLTWYFSLPTTTDWDVTHARLHGFQFGSEHGRGAIPLTPKGTKGAPDNVPASVAFDSDHYWQPLADLITQLPGLADVVYRCPSQFPPCLLKAMHANKRPARLHLQLFKLRSAYDDSDTIDPHERDLITSPCLHSIWLQYMVRWSWSALSENDMQLPSRQLDALEWMVKRGVSPCLREVKVVGSGGAEPDVGPWNPTTFFNRGQGGALRAFPTDKGHLTHLKFDPDVCTTPHESIFGGGQGWIAKLDSLTDFSLLRTLALVQPLSQAQLFSLQTTYLPELAALSLNCELPLGEETASSRSGYFQTITGFLSSLPSLTALQVFAWDHAQHVFSFHNSKLERLLLSPIKNQERRRFKTAICDMQQYLTLEGLKVLVSSFPRLIDLSIPVKRSRGDSTEVTLYRYLGEHLPNLRRLSLRLDCSPPPFFWISQNDRETPLPMPDPPSWQARDSGFIYPDIPYRFNMADRSDHDTPLPKPYPSGPSWPSVSAALNRDSDEYARDCQVNRYRNGHIYDILINSALDASLARKIFSAVGGNVETLLVQTYGGLNFPQLGEPPRFRLPMAGTMLGPFLKAIGKQWMVERMNDKVVVKELGLERFWGSPMDPLRILPGGHQAVMQCFRRVWPDKKEGSKGWFDDWESWGLETE
jgi:hypothetical protein